MTCLYNSDLRKAGEITDFITNNSYIRYALDISETGTDSLTWIFSDNLRELLKAIAHYNWNNVLDREEQRSIEHCMNKDFLKFIHNVQKYMIIYGVDSEEFEQHLLAYILEESSSYPIFYDLNANDKFEEMLEDMRGYENDENFDWKAYENDQQEFAIQYEKEKIFEKELNHSAKLIAPEVCIVYPFNTSLLVKILIDNKQSFAALKMYDNKMRYISTRGELAAYKAVQHVGNVLSLSKYKALKVDIIYSEIVNAYEYYSEIILLTSWDHLLRVLTSIKNKTSNIIHKRELEKYIKSHADNYTKAYQMNHTSELKQNVTKEMLNQSDFLAVAQ